MLDYKTYEFSFKEKIYYYSLGGIFIGCVLWIFFRSYYLLPLSVLFLNFYIKKKKTELTLKRRESLVDDFRRTLGYIKDALKLGYSLEKAFVYAKDEILRFDRQSLMAKELMLIVNKLEINIRLEVAIKEFATRSGIREIELFTEIIEIAKKRGGNAVQMISNCSSLITDIIDTKKDIGVILASKVNEKRIMEKIPLGIILYIHLTAPEILQPLYTSLLGRVIMCISLAMYVAAVLWAERIIRLEI